MRVIVAALALLVGSMSVAASASPASNPDFFRDIVKKVSNGTPPLSCSISAAWAAGKVGRETREAYELGDWRGLARNVLEAGYGDDGAWFMLGRSAEGLGDPESAKIFYERALALLEIPQGFSRRNLPDGSKSCRCVGFTCFTVDPLEHLVKGRLARLNDAPTTPNSAAHFENQFRLARDLAEHVTFHQCHRWAKSESTEAIRKWTAAILAGAAAGIAAGEIVGGDISRTAMAGFGVQTALSYQLVGDIYTAVRFPESIKTESRDFNVLFPRCMSENGLRLIGESGSSFGWALTDERERELRGVEAVLKVEKSGSGDSCVLTADYENASASVVAPRVSLTLLNDDSDSLEQYDVSFPAIFPKKNFRREVPLLAAICRGASKALVTSAVDSLKSQSVKMLLGVELQIIPHVAEGSP